MTIRKLGKVLAFSFGGLLLLVLLAMLGVKLALDRAPQYQAEIKQWLYSQTGYHITFAHVSPAFRWYGPELYFEQLELRSKDDQRVLARAAGGRVAADIWQLIRSGKLLAGRIEVESPNISVVRLGPTRFAVASEIELGGEDSSLGSLRLGDLPAGRLVIRHAVLGMENWNTLLPQLTLQGVDIDVRRDARELTLAFSAQLPPELGGTVSFEGHARGSGDVQNLAWDALAKARDISFPGWHRFLPETLSNLSSGTGAFDIAALGHGATLARADVDFGATDVAMLLPEGPVAKFDQMSGALPLTHAGDQWSLRGQGVRVAPREPESAFDIGWQEAPGGLLNLRASATYLRAESLLPLTGLLPQKDLRERLREIAPSGEWTDVSIAFERAQPAEPWRMQVQAKFQHAGLAAVNGVPGLRGIAGSIAGTERGGQVSIDTNVGVFHWPTQFPKSVELERLKANIYWKRTAAELLIASPDWEIKTHDADIRGQIAWHQPSDESSPVLTLVGGIQNGNAANARYYLPNGLIGPGALAWLNQAFVAGRLRASLLFQGPVRKFPFRDGGGIFSARTTIEGLTLNYSEGWAPAENLAVSAEFRNQGMSARMLSGRIGDLVLESGEAHFPDFNSGELKIHANARGDAASALTFLRASPLDSMAEHAFSNVEARGPLEATVDLFLPFKDLAHRQVLIHGRLDGASVNRTGSPTTATDVAGGFEIAGGDAQILSIGGSVQRLDLGGWLRLSAQPKDAPKDAKPLSYYMRNAKLNVAELDYLGLAFRDVSLDLLVSERSWRINVGGPNVSGTITIPNADVSTEPWSLQFDRLQFDVADAEDSATAGSSANVPPDADPRGMPPLYFHAKELIWGERQFGDVTATLAKEEEGVALKSLSVTAPTFSVNAEGEWRAQDAGVSRIKGTLTSTDVQGTLKDLGYADVIQAKSGKMEFDLTWLGAPTTAALAQVVGHVQLSLEKGQVLGLKPGAGRVLGFTSIAALPRRLALDFSDLTDKGLAFDSVHGDFDLRDGNAYTENVLLKGPAAEIGLIGRVGLKNKDYDQTAVITTSVGSSLSIPVASTLVCGPVCGAAALLFTQVFKQPLKGLARGYYRITGSWDNPTVERIKSAEAAAATAEVPK